MIASAGPYPTFLERLPNQGPIMGGLSLLLLAVFVFGTYRLWRSPALTFLSVIVIGAPTLIGCLLAVFQSFAAQAIAEMHDARIGIVYIGRPDRYIGHIRVYLIIGIVMSLFLFCVALFSGRRQSSP